MKKAIARFSKNEEIDGKCKKIGRYLCLIENIRRFYGHKLIFGVSISVFHVTVPDGYYIIIRIQFTEVKWMSVKESYTVECAGDAAGELQTLLLEQLLRQIRTEAGSDPANKKKHC